MQVKSLFQLKSIMVTLIGCCLLLLFALPARAQPLIDCADWFDCLILYDNTSSSETRSVDDIVVRGNENAESNDEITELKERYSFILGDG